jgi:hypothetical protein
MADDAEKDWAWLRDEWVKATPWERGDFKMLQSPHEPTFQKNMEDVQTSFRRGNKHALVTALSMCLLSRRPLPSWVSRELWHAFKRFEGGQLSSWEDVFGKPFPGKRRKGSSTRRKAREVWIRVQGLREEGRKLDDLLFEEVGKEFGFGATTAKNLYYEYEHSL